MNDEELVTAQARVALIEKARRAIERRRHTDRPGSDWYLLNDTRNPAYGGARSIAHMYASDDGRRFEVIIYSYQGEEILRNSWRSLDVAFRNGRIYANTLAQKSARS